MSTTTLPLLLQTLGLSTSFIYAGFSFCASHLVVPLLYPLPPAHSTVFFRAFFHNGAVPAISLALVSTLSSWAAACSATPDAAVFGLSPRAASVLAGVVVISGLPWTQVVLMPVNNRLIALSWDPAKAEKAGAEVVRLLRSWRWMNFVRAGLALSGGVLGLVSVAGQVVAV